MNFTIFPAFNVMPVKGYDTNSVTFKDVRAHSYCASLVRTLFIRHARATSFSSSCTELKTQQNIELTTFVLTWCANIFVGCSVIPTFFWQITSFPDSSHYTKKRKKIFTWEVLIFFSNTIQIGSNWYMDTGVRDLEVAFFLRLILLDLMTCVAKIDEIDLHMLC